MLQMSDWVNEWLSLPVPTLTRPPALSSSLLSQWQRYTAGRAAGLVLQLFQRFASHWTAGKAKCYWLRRTGCGGRELGGGGRGYH